MKSSKSSIWAYLVVAVSGLFIGAFLFSLNPWMKEDLYSNSYAWFLDFSRSIFQPQSAYYAESILLPLLAKLVGASRTLFTYKFFCSILIISILPVTAVFAQRYFQNIFKTLLFIFLFGLSFQYLQYYILGFPDPLTILLMLLAVLQKRLGPMFALLVIAMLSHFSMAAMSVISLLGLFYFSPDARLNFRKKLVGIALVSILAGKTVLLIWYTVFHYQLNSRLDWALGKGLVFFLERYDSNATQFWLTPGIPFLAIYFLIFTFFFLQKRFFFVLSAFLALVIAYVALFWTVDGLRVFAVVVAAPYGYLLITFIQSVSDIAFRRHSKINSHSK